MNIRIKDGVLDYSDDYFYLSKDKSIVIWGEVREYREKDIWLAVSNKEVLSAFSNAQACVLGLSGAFLGIYTDLLTGVHQVFSSVSECVRCYFLCENGNWFFSTDVDTILDQKHELSIDPFEYEYYLINGFSTGFSTYIQDLYKILPGEIVTCNSSFISDYEVRMENTCLESALNQSTTRFESVSSFEEVMDKRLINSLADKKNIAVLFSGGADSTFLLLKLKALFPNKNITPICFYSNQLPSANILSDKEKATNMANYIGFKLLVIDPLENEELGDSLRQNNSLMPFDSHISFWHGGSLRQIEDEFDCIVTGQNADGVYNFGPTGKLRLKQIITKHTFKEAGIAEVAKRALFETNNLEKLRNGKPITHRILLKLLEKYYHMPKSRVSDINYDNFYAGFLAEEKYVPNYNTKTLKQIDGSSSFVDCLKKISKSVTENVCLSERKKLLILKYISFVQGADVRVLTELFDHSNGSKVYFPYTSLPALEAFANYDLTMKDTIHAKQFIYQYLDNRGIDVFEFTNEFHTKMLSDMQVWHIINAYLYKFCDISKEDFRHVFNLIPDWVNSGYLQTNLENFVGGKEYNITIVFRFLWSLNILKRC